MKFQKTKILFLLILFLGLFGWVESAWAATYYIDYDNGADTNNGTSKLTPWKHAPGMGGNGATADNCVDNCKTYQDAGGVDGDQWILKGGVIWPNATQPWDWVYGTHHTAPIYIGVDLTWYDSSTCAAKGYLEFCRPVIDAQSQAIATSQAGAGPYLKNTQARFYYGGFSIDDIEFTGLIETCPGSDKTDCGNNGLNRFTSLAVGDNTEVKNCYFHGWSHDDAVTTTGDMMFILATGSGESNYTQKIHNNIWDGSDTAKDIGQAWTGSAGHVYNNYIAYMQNGAIVASGATGGPIYVWGNTFREISCNFEDFDVTQHHQSWETYGTTIFYNNYVNCSAGGGTILTYGMSGYTDYIFNNVFISDHNQVLQIGSDPNNGGNFGIYIFNNTLQTVNGGDTPNSISGPNNLSPKMSFMETKNNHIIGPTPNVVCDGSGVTTCTATDNTSQTNAQATAANYLSSSTYPYFPPAEGATIDTGYDMSSICSSIPSSSPSLASTACLSDTTLGVSYDETNHEVSYPNHTAVTRSAWDIGAYEYVSGDTVPPAAPSGLSVS